MNKKIKYKTPSTITHKETTLLMNGIVRRIQAERDIREEDIPLLHRMATSYDIYLTCVEVIARLGPTDTNIKGETVKRPEVNIARENWSQYLEIAKEYGFTVRSRKIIRGTEDTAEPSPLESFLLSSTTPDK